VGKKWHPEACNVCMFHYEDLYANGCCLEMYEEIDINEVKDHRNAEITQRGRNGSFYPVGSQVPSDDQSDGRFEPVVYSSLPSSRMALLRRLEIVARARNLHPASSDADFLAFVANTYKVPAMDDEDRFYEDLESFIHTLPMLERAVVLDTAFTNYDFDDYLIDRVMDFYTASIQGEKGDKTLSLGKNMHKVFCHTDEEVCMWGRHFRTGRLFYYAIEDAVQHPVENVYVEHPVPDGYESYLVTYGCGTPEHPHRETIVLKAGLDINELNAMRDNMVCSLCFEDVQTAYAKKQVRLADLAGHSGGPSLFADTFGDVGNDFGTDYDELYEGDDV